VGLLNQFAYWDHLLQWTETSRDEGLGDGFGFLEGFQEVLEHQKHVRVLHESSPNSWKVQNNNTKSNDAGLPEVVNFG